MTVKTLICVDIGSTYTKGALISIDLPYSILRKAICPTTQNDLSVGFLRVLSELLDDDSIDKIENIRCEMPVYFSSSAKGGLGIVSIGIVPDLTANIARTAAMSAGGKVLKSYSYSLTKSDITEIENIKPDIVLFCGGTDGGNTSYLLRNAALLAESRMETPIVYAGNKAACDEISSILKNKELVITQNIMPDIGVLNIEPVREIIRKLFLERIIVGKGLSKIADRFGGSALPTPLGVFELINAVSRFNAEWRDICAIDLGGATTDFYSNTETKTGSDSVIIKGAAEPKIKRTVEGDLGMRVSAKSLLESSSEYLFAHPFIQEEDKTAFCDYVDFVSLNPSHKASSDKERRYDEAMAEACVYYSAMRHAGFYKEIFTPSGKVFIQTGKDLRAVGKIIGSGGYLSCCQSPRLMKRAFDKLLKSKLPDIVLAPENPLFYADSKGLFPILGNLAGPYPEAAAVLALASLRALN